MCLFLMMMGMLSKGGGGIGRGWDFRGLWTGLDWWVYQDIGSGPC